MHLAHAGWVVGTASARRARVARLVDMVGTAWRRRATYDVAQVDVYSGAAFAWAEAVVAALRAARKPFVLTLHGGNLPTFSRRWPSRVQRLLRRAAVVTTPSRYLLEAMRPYRDDLLLLPNAIDLSQYHARMRAPVVPRLVWLRAYHEIYNPVLAVEAVAAVAEWAPQACLAMAGANRGDGAFERTRAALEARGLAGRVTLRAGVSKTDVPAWLDAGDVFLNTANVDNTPVSVIEAMASGLCVVSTNVGGIPYLLDSEQDALLVPPNDAPAMAEAVHCLVRDPALAERLSNNARAKARQFDWGAVLPRWGDVLTCAAERRVRTP